MSLHRAFEVGSMVGYARNQGGAAVGVAVALGIPAAIFVGGVFYLGFGLVGLVGCVMPFVLIPAAYWGVRANNRANARNAALAAEADKQARLAQFPPQLHHAIARLSDPWSAAQMWASIGLGREPRWVGSGPNAWFDPGAWPAMLPNDIAPLDQFGRIPPNWVPDYGTWSTDIGVRVRLTMCDGQEGKHFEARRAQLAAALDIPSQGDRQPNVRVAGVNGNQILLDLKCFDPLAGMNVSHLLDKDTAEKIKWSVGEAKTPAHASDLLTWASAGLRLTVPVNGLSCVDDIYIGISEFGEWVTVNLAAGIHGAIQGASRSGKSITLNTLLAYASLMRDVRVCVIDPNTALVAPWWRTAHKVCRSSRAEDATAVLEEVIAELKARESQFWAARTDRITQFSPELPCYLVVIDEVGTYSDDKDFQAALKECSAQLAKYGGRLYLAGQKLSEKSLDTGTRANLYDRVCHRVETDDDYRHLFPDASSLAASGLNARDDAMPQGVAIVRMRTSQVPVRMRSVYLPTEACWAISDAIVAVRGETRPLPGSKPAKVQAIGNTQAINPTDASPVETSKPERQYPALPPRVTQLRQGRTVVPFDKPKTDTGTD